MLFSGGALNMKLLRGTSAFADVSPLAVKLVAEFIPMNLPRRLCVGIVEFNGSVADWVVAG